jgi:hypothetical protein
VREKDAARAALEATLSTYREKAGELQKRLDELERLRRSELESAAGRLRAAEGLLARLDGAERLAADLDHSLDAMETLVTGLRERVRRLRDGLRVPSDASPPSAPPVSSLVEKPAPAEVEAIAPRRPEAPAPSPAGAPAEAVPLISPPE